MGCVLRILHGYSVLNWALRSQSIDPPPQSNELCPVLQVVLPAPKSGKHDFQFHLSPALEVHQVYTCCNNRLSRMWLIWGVSLPQRSHIPWTEIVHVRSWLLNCWTRGRTHSQLWSKATGNEPVKLQECFLGWNFHPTLRNNDDNGGSWLILHDHRLGRLPKT